MLYLSFSNYAEFRQMFPCRTYDGRTTRDNKILLSLLKRRWILHDPLRSVRSMADMESSLLERIQRETEGEFTMSLAGMTFRSSEYRTDDRNGICDDDDAEQIRIIKREPDGNGSMRDKVYKNKAGKLFRKIVASTPVGRRLPEEVVNYLCEVFKLKWLAHAQQIISGFTLHVDDNFAAIYDQHRLLGSFGSCMVDKGHHPFYQKSVDALAAYITDRSGRIKARAVIYTHALDEADQPWRLCERQYSTGSDLSLKRTLVNLLIAGGHIDGYKQIGADCHNATAFVDNQGRSLSNKRFRIPCRLDCDDILSYQDSFKWYSLHKGFAYNYNVGGNPINLASTCRKVEVGRSFTRRLDEYHNCNTFHTVIPVIYRGRLINCAQSRLEDFRVAKTRLDGFIRTRPIHKDEVSICPECNTAYHSTFGVHSDMLNRDFCCDDCRARAERAYREGHCAFAEDVNAWIIKEEAFYSTLIDAYYSTDVARLEAELRFKADNWDWCDDVKTYVDPDTTFWSRRTRKFYSTSEARLSAERSLAA